MSHRKQKCPRIPLFFYTGASTCEIKCFPKLPTRFFLIACKTKEQNFSNQHFCVKNYNTLRTHNDIYFNMHTNVLSMHIYIAYKSACTLNEILSFSKYVYLQYIQILTSEMKKILTSNIFSLYYLYQMAQMIFQNFDNIKQIQNFYTISPSLVHVPSITC